MLASLVACNKTKRPDVLIWHTYTKDQQVVLEDAVKRFNETNEWKIKVEIQQQDRKDFASKVRQAVRNNVGPDIIIDYATTAADYAKNGKLVNFLDLVNDEKEGIPNFLDNVLEGTLNEITKFVDGGMYVFPIIQSGPIFVYNKDIYDELGLTAPKTWAELEQNSVKIKEKYPDKYGFAFESLPDGAQTLIAQANNGVIIDAANKKTAFDTPEVAKWLEWFGNNVKSGNFILNPTGQYFSEDFNSQLLASYIGSVAGVPYLKFKNFATAPVPQGAGDTEWVPAWNRSILLFKSNKDQELNAFRFIKFFASPEENFKFCKAVNYASPLKSTLALPEYQEYVKNTIGLEHLRQDVASAYAPIPGTMVLRDGLKALMTEVSSGTPVREALDKLIKEADTALADAN